MKENKLSITEESDFAYLLELLLPLHNVPEFAWLPELFSIIGYEKLLLLCKYAGGETIAIPTIDQIKDSMDALQCFYDIRYKGKTLLEVPKHLVKLVMKISEVFDVRNNTESD